MPDVPKTRGRAKKTHINNGLKKTARLVLMTLESIERGLEIYEVMARSSKYRPLGIEGAKRVIAARERRALYAAMRELRRKKRVERRRVADKLVDVMTAAGEELYAKLRLQSAGKLPNGQHAFVSYDIPEDARNARDAFRRLLKRSGFRMVHHSLWETEKDVGEALASWVRCRQIDKWVSIRIGRPP